MPHFNDMVYHLGGLPVMAGVPFSSLSNYYFVDATNGNDTNDGLLPETALAGIEAAYAKTTANQHDTIFLIGRGSAVNMSAALTWANNYTHLIGICAPCHVGQRARIAYETGAVAASPLITVSATGCIFKNVYIFHGIASASNLINVKVTGQRNYFENVHFAGGGNATQAVDGGASLNLNGSASENKFVGCTIGVDTIAASTGMTGLLIDGGTGSIHTTRNMFKDCNFTMKAGSGGASFVELMQINAIDRYTIFDGCQFINLAATAMDSAFVIPSGIDPSDKRLLLKDCVLIGATDWDAGDRGAMYLSGGTATAGGYTGLYQASEVT
jgi:hypothetical protein